MSGAMLSVVRVPALRPADTVVALPWRDDPSDALARHFRNVRDTRMAGLPFLNAAVDVRIADCVPIGGDWLAAVVTPWSVMLVLLPGGGTLWQDLGAGARRAVRLPVGELTFIAEVDVGEAGAPALQFQYCPLVSPLDGVADTDAACAIARDALATALTPPVPESPLSAEVVPQPADVPDSPSRRAFLRGGSR